MASAVIGALRVDLGIDTASFSNGLKDAGSKLSGFGSVLRNAVVPIAAAVTASVIGIGASIKRTIDAADEMSKASAKFGIPIEELSRLKYAADLSNVSLDGLGTSVGKLSRNMADAAGGSKSAADAFKAVGVEFQNSDGTLRSSSDVLNDIADRFAAMPDGAAKTAAAMELMGRSGAEMIPMLNSGSKALADMKAEADTFGQVFTKEMGAQSEQFNDNITRLSGAFGNLSADLTKKLLPYLTQFTDWLVANGPQLATNAGNFIDFAATIISAIGSIKPLLDDFSAGMHLIVNGIVEIGTEAMNLPTKISTGFNSVVETIKAKVGEIKDALASLIDQFIQMGRDLIDGLIQGIKERVAAAVEAVRGAAGSIISTAKSVLGIQSPSTVFADIGTDIMQGLAQGLSSRTGEVQSDMGSFATNLATTFADVLTGATNWRDAMHDILSSVGGSFINAGIGGLGKIIGIPGFANGTDYAPGGLAIVGENGAELIDLPKGSRVTPNDRIGNLGTGKMEIVLGAGLEARFLNQAAAQSVKISSQVVRQTAPGVVSDSQRRRG